MLKSIRKSVRKSRKSVRKSVRKSKKRKNDGGLKPFLQKIINELNNGVKVDSSEYDTKKVIKLTFNESIYDMVEILPYQKYRIGLDFIERDMGDLDLNKTTTNMSNKILETLVSTTNNKYALIYCHNRKWNNVVPHWLKNQIEAYCDKNKEKKPITYLTLDILEGGDLKNDGFSLEFINSYKECFDFVFLPDCGGEWYDATSKGDYEKINEILNNISSLLKKDGQLLFSKIVNDSLKTKFSKVDDFYKDDDIFKNNFFYKF